MSISNFFENHLRTPLRNYRWSWGAINYAHKIVFLRIWDSEIDHQTQRVEVFDETYTRSPKGQKERRLQLSFLDKGYKFYGVICHPKTNKKGEQRIASYKTEELISLNAPIFRSDNKNYLQVGKMIGINEIPNLPFSNQEDEKNTAEINEILDSDVAPTTKMELFNARLGQGKFRSRVLRQWENCCAVTGCSVADAIRASHIKPWSKSNDAERLDRNNGIPLLATIDALFDRGLITFNPRGELVISPKLSPPEIQKIGPLGSLRRRPSEPQAKYLQYHLEHVFKK